MVNYSIMTIADINVQLVFRYMKVVAIVMRLADRKMKLVEGKMRLLEES